MIDLNFLADDKYVVGAQTSVAGLNCHNVSRSAYNASGAAGRFGDYRCDAPRILVDSALSFMNRTPPRLLI